VLQVLVVLQVLGGAPGRGAIAGQVVDGVTGRPIAGAVVAISGPELIGVAASLQPAAILTAADGRFVFRDLPLNLYSVTATKGGYAEGEPGRRRPGGAAPGVVLTAAESTADVTVPMWRYSAIAGVVSDEAGEPVVSLQVRALKRESGRRTLSAAATTFTDDRGVYRFGMLTPGEYLVVASPAEISVNAGIFVDFARTGYGHGGFTALVENDGKTPAARVGDALLSTGRGTAVPPPPAGHRVQIYPPTFYPSTLAPAQASRITLGVGEERTGVDVQIVPAPTVRVSGTVLSAGSPAPMIVLKLVPAGADTIPLEIVGPTSITDGDGNFTFAGVIPGSYALRASTGPGSMGWIEMPLQIGGGDLDNLALQMNPPLRVRARTRFEGASPPPSTTSRFVSPPFHLAPADFPLDGMTVAGIVDEATGAFTQIGYVPGRYRVRVQAPPAGWMLKAAIVDGVDALDMPFELKKDTDLTLVYTDRWSGVKGRVDGARADATVLLFSADPSSWGDAAPDSRRFRSARIIAQGEFSVSGVPPGDYLIVAVPEDQAIDWRDASSLASLSSGATALSIAEGETKIVVLRLKDAR
jgi:hypothetical protein